MRTWGSAALVLVLAACGGGTKTPVATAPPTSVAPTPSKPSPSAAPERPGDVVVAEALKATRAKGTAAFTVEGTTSFGEGHFTMTREGAYDLRAGRAKVTQSFDAEPKALVKELFGEDVDLDKLVAHSVTAKGVAYLQMPAWPASIRSKWLRVTSEQSSAAAGVDVSFATFPDALAMLEAAKATTVPRFGNTYYVAVPAPVAIRATPGVSGVKALVQAGVKIDELAGTVQVGVDVVGGVITAVKFDAIEVYRQAWTKAGQAQLAGAVTSVETMVKVSDHGKAGSIAIPTAVMTEQEFANSR